MRGKYEPDTGADYYVVNPEDKAIYRFSKWKWEEYLVSVSEGGPTRMSFFGEFIGHDRGVMTPMKARDALADLRAGIIPTVNLKADPEQG